MRPSGLSWSCRWHSPSALVWSVVHRSPPQADWDPSLGVRWRHRPDQTAPSCIAWSGSEWSVDPWFSFSRPDSPLAYQCCQDGRRFVTSGCLLFRFTSMLSRTKWSPMRNLPTLPAIRIVLIAQNWSWQHAWNTWLVSAISA